MYFTILQNVVLLLLAGVGAYAIFTSAMLRNSRQLQQGMFGFLMGTIIFLMANAAFHFDFLGFPVDGKAGPLVFAGYLGGPLGGGIAVLMATISRLAASPDASLVAPVLFYSCFALVGIGTASLAPFATWPEVTGKAIRFFFAGFFLAELVPLPIVANTVLGEDWTLIGLKSISYTIAGWLSIAAIGFVLGTATRIARDERLVSELGNRLRLIEESGRFGIYERRSGDSRIQFDEGTRHIYGLAEGSNEIDFSEWLGLVVPEDRARLAETIRRIWESKSQNEVSEFRIRRSDGATRDIRMRRVMELDAKALPSRIVGIQEDVTGQRESERQKLMAEARLKRVVDNLPGMIISTDISDADNWRVTFASPRSKEILGLEPEALTSRVGTFARTIHPEDAPDVLAALRNAAETATGFTKRFRIITGDGELKWLESNTGVERLEDGRVIADGIILDVTREVEAELELAKQTTVAQRAQKHESIGQLTGGVAHDFNNLLSIVMGNLEILRDDIDAPEQRRLIDSSLGATRRGADLTRSMLAFARKSHLEPSLIALNDLVEETRDWAGRTLPANIEIETTLFDGLWPVEADSSSTQSALLNLIVNARDAMPDGGKLMIETTNLHVDEQFEADRQDRLAPGRYVVLSVRDSGQGIPLEQLSLVFEPFFSTKPPGAGSGLGLSMVQGFMQQSGGAVRLHSEPGIGTTFKLFFRAKPGQSHGDLAPESVADEHTTDGKRLLLVEDEPEVLKSLVSMLQRAGYSVTPVQTGDDARAVFERDPSYDLLLTDIVMPGNLQGIALSRVLRTHRPDLPVVFMSGYSSEAAVHGNSLSPEDIRLMKPFSRSDLLAAIARSLEP